VVICALRALLPNIANGNTMITSSSADVVVGSYATYTCDTGFRLNGDAVRDCIKPATGVIGVWTNTAPTCDGM